MRAYIAVLMGAAHNTALAEAVATFNRESATEFGRLIGSAIEAGDIRPDIDARTQALILSAALRGIMAQWVLDPAGVDSLSKLPGKPELQASLLMTFLAAPTDFVRTVIAAPQNFAYLLDARKRHLEQQ